MKKQFTHLVPRVLATPQLIILKKQTSLKRKFTSQELAYEHEHPNHRQRDNPSNLHNPTLVHWPFLTSQPNISLAKI